MEKWKKIITVLCCIMILSGCSMIKAKNKEEEVSSKTPLASNISDKFKTKDTPEKENSLISPLNLNTEKDIRAYLIGEWIYDQEYITDTACKISIDKNLKIDLSFYDRYSNEPKGDYTGKIEFDWVYANPNEAPDLFSIRLTDPNNFGGKFFFKHRTIYDEKRVMSWFIEGAEKSIFNLLAPEEFQDAGPGYVPEDIMFEKVTGEKSKLRPHKNEEFHAIFWGKGPEGESLWLDDARWTPPEEDDFTSVYPREMTFYENDVPESVLYNIVPQEMEDILKDAFFPGEVYLVQTDEKGSVVSITRVENEGCSEEGWDEGWYEDGDGETDLDFEKEMLIFDIIENDVEEITGYLKLGMTIMITGGTMLLGDEPYYLVELGTNHEEHFVGEIFYAVSTDTREVYRYDVLNDLWELVSTG